VCRLLLLHHPDGVEPAAHLDRFREISRHSTEYQGHGWGCAWLDGDRQWRLYHDIRPVWDDTGPALPRTPLFLAHARSAFRDEGIAIENNMPFGDGENVFLFNGELRGVRIREAGRIGAEKIFNYIKRFDKGDMEEAVRRGVAVIQKRTRYIRAMNFFLADRHNAYICSMFNEQPGYFQLRECEMEGVHVVCSERYLEERYDWRDVANGTVRRIEIG